jgi:hypothetical protein
LALQVARDRPGAQFGHCLFDSENPPHHLAVGECRIGDSKQEISLALWGDSHAMAWAPMLSALQSNGGPVFKLYSMASCQPLLGSMSRGIPHDYCAEFNENTYREIISLKAQGLQGVVLSGRWVTLRHPSISRYDAAPEHAGIRSLIRQIRSKREPSTVAPTDVLDTGLAETARALTESGLRVLILLDPPEVRQPIPACVFVHFPDIARCGISRAEHDEYTSDVRKTISELPARFPGVRTIDPTNQFCDETQCPAFFQGGPTLFDDDHISSSAARSLAAGYQPYIRWLLRR